MADLENLVDEYYQAMGMDVRRENVATRTNSKKKSKNPIC